MSESFPLSGSENEEMTWQERALCAQTDPEAFFPEKGGSTREAKRVCLSCDVRSECLDYALAHDERFGIWGGLSERERRRLVLLVRLRVFPGAEVHGRHAKSREPRHIGPGLLRLDATDSRTGERPDQRVARAGTSRGRHIREFDGHTYLMERALVPDVSLVKAWKADQSGNLVFRRTARNFNPNVAMAGRLTIAEVEVVVPNGEIDPDAVHLPGIYVNRLVLNPSPEKRIEQRTTRPARQGAV